MSARAFNVQTGAGISDSRRYKRHLQGGAKEWVQMALDEWHTHCLRQRYERPARKAARAQQRALRAQVVTAKAEDRQRRQRAAQDAARAACVSFSRPSSDEPRELGVR